MRLKSDQEVYQSLATAQQQLEQGKAEIAYQMVDKLISHTPTRGELYATAGEALLELGKISKSITAYHQAIKHYPNYYLYQLRLGELMMMEGETLTAEQYLLNSINYSYITIIHHSLRNRVS